jgi:hypothetical protein
MIVFVPSQFQTRPIISNSLDSCLIQKIVYFLLIYLKIRTIHSKLLLLQVSLLFNQIIKMMNAPWHYTIIIHHVTWRSL